MRDNLINRRQKTLKLYKLAIKAWNNESAICTDIKEDQPTWVHTCSCDLFDITLNITSNLKDNQYLYLNINLYNKYKIEVESWNVGATEKILKSLSKFKYINNNRYQNIDEFANLAYLCASKPRIDITSKGLIDLIYLLRNELKYITKG